VDFDVDFDVNVDMNVVATVGLRAAQVLVKGGDHVQVHVAVKVHVQRNVDGSFV
jgi:hypothetical protein